MQRIVFLVVTTLATLSSAFAQKGTVKGLVTDAATGEPFPFVDVYVKALNTGSNTDMDGNYSFVLPAGTHEVTVSSLGYETQKKKITVAAGQTVTLNVALKEEAFNLSEVTITSTKSTNTESSVLLEMKKSEQVVTGISAQQIKRTPDNDASQVVRRMPGITIQDDKFVIVRGLSNRYNAVMLNNAYAPSTEAETRSFSFDLIPSSLIDRIMVYKSPSPDVPGDFAGSVIKIYTQNVVEKDYHAINFTLGYRVGTTFKPYRTQERFASDLFGLGYSPRSLPAGFPSDLPPITDQASADFVLNESKRFTNNWTTFENNAFTDVRFRYEYGAGFYLGKTKVSAINAINYSNAFQTQVVDRYRFTGYEADGSSVPFFSYNDDRYENNVRLGFLSNWSFQLNPRNKVEFKNFLTQIGNTETTLRGGVNQNRNVEEQNLSLRYQSRFIYSGQFQGTHDFNEDRTTLTWLAGVTTSNKKEPDWRRSQSRRIIGADSVPFQVIVPASANQQNAARFNSALDELAFTLASDLEWIIKQDKLFKIKTGFFVESKSRDFSGRTIGYIRASANTDPDITNSPLETIFQDSHIRYPDGLVIGENTKYTDLYTATNLLAAYHLGFTTALTSRWNLAAGVRAEYNIQGLETPPSPSGFPVVVDNPVLSILPSVNTSYNLTKNTLVRFSYGMNVNRPEFRELAPFSFYNFDLSADIIGNAELEVATIHNLDLRYEWYPSASEIFAFGGFYKKFFDPIETIITTGADNPIFIYNNAAEAENFGVEMELRKNLDFISENLRNVGLSMNAALIKSQITLSEDDATLTQAAVRPLQGQSPYVVNAGLYYQTTSGKTQINANYNVSGKRIFLVGDNEFPTQWEMPRNLIDISITQQLTPSTTLRLGVSDLLNARYWVAEDANQDGKINSVVDQTVIETRTGQYIQLGINVKF